jgi:cytochrome c oxidase cbb3-type subunit 3
MSKKVDKKEVPTTGHSWDGIEEFDNPMPRWWLTTFYACIVFAVVYAILYPAWPMINKATPGLLGYSTRGELTEDLAAHAAKSDAINSELASTEFADITANVDLNDYAQKAGAAVFRTWCAQCHGSGAAGVQAAGYPNLLDDDWLWGGKVEDIHYTVTHGIRNTSDDDARYSEMPKFIEILEEEQIEQVVNFVMSLSGTAQDETKFAEGAVVFEENCSSCHGVDGKGDHEQGAPNLTDAIWLYGGDYERLIETVSYARYGVMPNWNARLSEAEIRAVALYVHSLGGGE